MNIYLLVNSAMYLGQVVIYALNVLYYIGSRFYIENVNRSINIEKQRLCFKRTVLYWSRNLIFGYWTQILYWFCDIKDFYQVNVYFPRAFIFLFIWLLNAQIRVAADFLLEAFSASRLIGQCKKLQGKDQLSARKRKW